MTREPLLVRLEAFLTRRSSRLTLTSLAIMLCALLLLTAPTWGEWIDALGAETAKPVPQCPRDQPARKMKVMV